MFWHHWSTLHRLNEDAPVCNDGVGELHSERVERLAQQRVKIDTLEGDVIYARANALGDQTVGANSIGDEERIGRAEKDIGVVKEWRPRRAGATSTWLAADDV